MRRSWCNMRFLSPVFFIDEVELIAEGPNAALANALLATLGFTSRPKMYGEKMLDVERVQQYYERQRVYASKGVPRAGWARVPAAIVPERYFSCQNPVELPDCAICLTSPAGALILPCGHTSTCHTCAVQLFLNHHGHHRCPICRGHIEKVLQNECPVPSAVPLHGMGSGAGWES